MNDMTLFDTSAGREIRGADLMAELQEYFAERQREVDAMHDLCTARQKQIEALQAKLVSLQAELAAERSGRVYDC